MQTTEASSRGGFAVRARGAGEETLRRTEWLLTSGHGAHAMGTASGQATRRYHGLLVGTLTPPVERVVALSCVRDRVTLGEGGGQEAELASFRFAGDSGEGATHPSGLARLLTFEASPERVVWVYDLGGGARAERELRVARHANRATLMWRVRSEDPARLEVWPFTTLRGFHELCAGETPDLDVETFDRGVMVRRGEIAARLEMAGAAFRGAPVWWENFGYELEKARGFDWVERLFTPGAFTLEFPAGGGEAALTATLEPAERAAEPGALALGQREASMEGEGDVAALRRAADAFVVRRRVGEAWSATILAGYPWFADWGRDAMIALPGLLLATGRYEESREVLETFAKHVRRGLVPNRFDDYGGEPHYNTVDASLWFLHAAREHARATGEDVGAGVIGRACASIVEAYEGGTDFGIGMDGGDGLIAAGGAGTQLTWMDAKTGDEAHTPRHGKAVEINALWVHGLRCAAALLPDRAGEFEALADRARASFAERFWNEALGCLHDCLTPAWGGGWEVDAAVRPNQVFAASLEFGPVTDEQRRSIVGVLRRELLTPMGLRTLSPEDSRYRGRYEGGPRERDSAYHNGTVWPWLIGAYVEASLRAEGFIAPAKERARRELAPLVATLREGCLGQVAEVYDGEEVGDAWGGGRRAAGCPAQAWSVAETLRALTLAQ